MKKALCLILTAAMVLCFFASCGKTETETTTEASTEATTEATETEEYTAPAYPYMNINDEPYTVTAKDGFDNNGFTVLLCDTDDTYTFTSSSDETTWNIYVLDAEFDDAVKYLPQAQEPTLKGNGSLEIKNGQYVYIECSCNAFTTDTANDDYLEITRAAAADTTAASEIKTGEYQDEYSQRAVADVTEKDGKYEILVSWGSSATEHTEWTMTAELKDGKLSYTDCTKSEIVDDGTDNTTTVEYENGTGYFEVQNGKLLWTGAQDTSCQECVFSIGE